MKTESADSGDDGGVGMKRILIVDDEVDITQTFVWLFEYHGFEVYSAADGKQALAIIHDRMPDMLISDCMMPVMDGIALSRQVRASPATRDIPIILMSAAPAQTGLSEAAFDVFLQKPFKFDVLLTEVKALLKKRSAGQTLRVRKTKGGLPP